MTNIIVLKIILMSCVWTVGWTFRFAYIAAPVSRKNVSIALAPWIIMFITFMLFIW
jgi:hypothetical protein